MHTHAFIIYTHTGACTDKHTYKYKHTRIRAYTHAHSSHIYRHTHTYAHTQHTHTHIHIHTLSNTHTHIHTYTRINRCTHIRTQVQADMDKAIVELVLEAEQKPDQGGNHANQIDWRSIATAMTRRFQGSQMDANSAKDRFNNVKSAAKAIFIWTKDQTGRSLL